MIYQKAWAKQIAQRMERHGQTLAMQPILELCGSRRIWLENHCGVKAYSFKQIRVGVHHGQIVINGNGLRLRKMQGPILVITGEIESILLEKE